MNTALSEGPYSALGFDYDSELKELEAKKQQQQMAQQKIARTNAIGDAFRLLVDGVGGSKNATITPKPVNQGILKATERTNALDKDFETGKQRLKLQDLAIKEKNLGYNLGIEAEGRANQRQLEKETRDEQAQVAREGRAFKNAVELAKVNNQNAIGLENQRSTNQIKEINARTSADRTAKEQEGAIVVTDNITGKDVTVYPQTIDQMIKRLQSGHDRYDPQLDKVAKQIMNAEYVNPLSLRNVLVRYWDDIRDLTPGLTAVEKPEGAGDQVQTGDTRLYQARLVNVLGNTSYSARRKRKLITEATMQQFPGMTEDEAEIIANDYISKTELK
jgi:hypothetical protein